jgi:DNA-binding response OmpR family regulator
LRVLLVDDEEEFARSVAKVLSRRGFEVEVALSGEAALGLLGGHGFDVVVMDLRMPGMGGMRALEQARRRFPALQVIILTGHGTTALGIEGMQVGAADFLSKPVDVDTLALAIQAVARRAAAWVSSSEEEET